MFHNYRPFLDGVLYLIIIALCIWIYFENGLPIAIAITVIFIILDSHYDAYVDPKV